MRPAAVALFVALQLFVGAPMQQRLVAAAQPHQELAPSRAAGDVLLARAGHGPVQRLGFHASPFVPARNSAIVAPAGAAGGICSPRARERAVPRPRSFSGPRGPPPVVVS